MKMSLISGIGTPMARMFLTQPGPKSKKKRSPLPSSTMMHVPAWSRRGGKGQLPTNEIRISSGPRVSLPGK